jgi:multidrug resistance efflux pump
MSKRRKIIWIVLAALVLAALVWGLVILRGRNHKAYVQLVADLNSTWVLSNESSSGTIIDADEQRIYLQPTDQVEEVYVTEGQQVAEGDALFRFDTRSANLELQEKQLEVENSAASLDIARQQLAAYEKITPVAARPEPEDPQDADPLSADQKLPRPSAGQGTEEDPYLYACTNKTIVTAEEINAWLANGQVVILYISGAQQETAKDPAEENEPGEETHQETAAEMAKRLNGWLIGENYSHIMEDGTYWHVATRSRFQPPMPEINETPQERTYTQAEKDKLISDQKLTIRRLENDLALAKNALEQSRKAMDGNTVRATMDGTIKTIGDPASPPKDGSPFCTVSGGAGVTLQGYISELDLEGSQVGDKISVTSWMSGTATEAEITEIADYPTDNTDFYGGEGNPNTSYYQFTAHMDSAEGFESGEWVDIQPFLPTLEEIIVLEKMYVRSDGAGTYVMVDDGNGRLERREVTIRPTSTNEYVEILSGLSAEDYVAFPYGKTARVGSRTTTEAPFRLF